MQYAAVAALNADVTKNKILDEETFRFHRKATGKSSL
jgi:hypothetical protein